MPSISQLIPESSAALLLLLDLVLLALFIALVRWGTRWVFRRLTNRYQLLIEENRLHAVRSTAGRQLLVAAVLLLRTVATLLVAVGVTVAVTYALAQFAWTERFAQMISEYVLAQAHAMGAAIWAYLPNLAVIALVVFLIWQGILLLRSLADALARRAIRVQGFHADWAKPTFDVVAVLLVFFGLVVIFPYLPGGDTPALRGVSIFIGVLVSLGSGSAMGNIVAGLIITYMRPYQVGDRVQIGTANGDVLEKSLLVTRLRTIKNEEIIVPNSTVLGAQVLNYSSQARQHRLILYTTITIGYDTPWQRVHELLIAAALATPNVCPNPRPFVLQTSLNDYHVSYQINAYTEAPQLMQDTYSALHANIQDQFRHAQLEILSPAYLAMRDGSASTALAKDPANAAPPTTGIWPGGLRQG